MTIDDDHEDDKSDDNDENSEITAIHPSEISKFINTNLPNDQ